MKLSCRPVAVSKLEVPSLCPRPRPPFQKQESRAGLRRNGGGSPIQTLPFAANNNRESAFLRGKRYLGRGGPVAGAAICSKDGNHNLWQPIAGEPPSAC